MEEPAARTVGADLSLYIEVPVKDLAAVLEAYQKDLSMLSFSEIDEANCVLHFQNRGQDGSSWNSEQYPISGKILKMTIRTACKAGRGAESEVRRDYYVWRMPCAYDYGWRQL